jgi:hypothetical protein
MSETRKLAAILFADVVGCSPLAGAHEDRAEPRAPVDSDREASALTVPKRGSTADRFG